MISIIITPWFSSFFLVYNLKKEKNKMYILYIAVH